MMTWSWIFKRTWQTMEMCSEFMTQIATYIQLNEWSLSFIIIFKCSPGSILVFLRLCVCNVCSDRLYFSWTSVLGFVCRRLFSPSFSNLPSLLCPTSIALFLTEIRDIIKIMCLWHYSLQFSDRSIFLFLLLQHSFFHFKNSPPFTQFSLLSFWLTTENAQIE